MAANTCQMKIFDAGKVKFVNEVPDLTKVSEFFDRSPHRAAINIINWKDFSYKPDVSFALAYTQGELLLKYYITEDYFKAEKTASNQMVYEDSCVEFFVSPEEDGVYYNFEFNGIGTCLMGIGNSRQNRVLADESIISKIRRQSSVGKSPVKEREGTFSWFVTIAIPFEVFFRHKIESLTGKIFRANFYKCGDKLKIPHYLTWNAIGTVKPDFHQPEYFGLLKFV
jgi:hypothetical protein